MSKEISKETTSEQKLIRLLQASTVSDLATQSNEQVKILVYDLSVGLTIEKALESPKLFQLRKSLGMPTLMKLICVVLKSFCDSIKATKTMDSVDIMECAELIVEKYTHDSVKDIILALKSSKLKGMNFYNTVSTPIIFEILSEYFEKKTGFIEKRSHDEKSKYDGSVRTEAQTRVVEQEKRREEIEKSQTQKELNAIKSEAKELNKIKDFISNNIIRID